MFPSSPSNANRVAHCSAANTAQTPEANRYEQAVSWIILLLALSSLITDVFFFDVVVHAVEYFGGYVLGWYLIHFG